MFPVDNFESYQSQKLMSSFHNPKKVSRKSLENFLRNPANGRTNKHPHRGKQNITSLAEVITAHYWNCEPISSD